jgi:hypothetical protein
MPSKPMSHGEVHAVENELEISPSCHQSSSKIYSGSSDNPSAKAHSPKNKSGAGGTMTNSESGFSEKGSAKRRNMAVKP